MYKLIATTLLVTGFLVGAVAQGVSPAAELVDTIAVREAGALTFVPGTELLFIADGVDLQLYNVGARGDTQDVISAVMDNRPVSVAATAEFALTAVNTGRAADMLWVYDEDIYSPSGFGVVNALEIPAETRQIVVSPGQQWGLVYGSTGFVTLELIAADNILASTVFDDVNAPIIAAALTNDHALVARQGSTRIEAIDLAAALAAQAAPVGVLELGVGVTALSVSPDLDLAAVAVENNRVTLFDPAALQPISTITLDDGPVSAMAFGSASGGQYLALLIEGRAAALLLNVSDPANVSLPGSVGLPGAARALAVDGAQLAISTGDQVSLFEVSLSG